MPYTKAPSYLKLHRRSYYLKLPIPADLRGHYTDPGANQRTHIVEPLHTDSPREAERLKKARLAYWWADFERIRKERKGSLPSENRKAEKLREAIEEAIGAAKMPDPHGWASAAVEHLRDQAAQEAERIEEEAGLEAAQQFFKMATQPGKLTLLKAQQEMHATGDLKGQTKVHREVALRELLQFLKVPDCLPEFITDDRAVAYVEWLNKTDLTYATKLTRISALKSLWKFLHLKRQVAKGVSPWTEHHLTGKNGNGSKPKRAWTDEEIIRLYSGPEEQQSRKGGPGAHYTRPLMLDLYTLGFLTGMRLEEICSLTAGKVTEDKKNKALWVKIDDAKSEAGVRTIPVVHPTALAILKRRTKKREATDLLFPECRPGGPDNKQSWHVQKAMGRDRDRLGIPPEVDFHSTRRSFLTVMDNSGIEVVHVQRYAGHKVPTLMHTVYSEGASRDNLLKVARAVKYPAGVEKAMKAISSGPRAL